MKKILLYTLVTIVVLIICILGYVSFILPDVDDAPDVKVLVTPERIENGKYLATHVAACMDCHSTRDWSRFSGPLVPESHGKGGEFFGREMGFPGEFYSKNLTPANLKNWTDGEIFRAITVGVDKDGNALFPVMPYKSYRKMDKEDIYDIIAYLRSLPTIEDQVPMSKADFPMNFIINTIPEEAALTERPNPSEMLKYGKYLVNAASCIDCHTQVEQGQPIPELAFSGGREFKMPNGILRSSNITPDKTTGIGNWDKKTFVSRFKAFSETPAHVSEGEFNTIMPWSMYAGMKENDLEAIYEYLKSLEPIKNEVVTFSAAE